MLHTSVPAYMVTLAAVVLWHLLAQPFASLPAAITRASLLFLAADVALTGFVTGVALIWGGLADAGLAKREAARTQDPGHISAANVDAGLRAFAAISNPEVATLSDAIGRVRWHHYDPLFQDVANDLARAGNSMVAAAVKSPSAAEREILEPAISVLRTLLHRLHELEGETHAAKISHARAMAGYIASKYGQVVSPAIDFGRDNEDVDARFR